MWVDYLTNWLMQSLDLFRLMAPYLILGFTLAGILHVLVPKAWVARHLGGRGVWASAKAAIVGTPLPLCSCGVVPFAGLLKRQGASKSAITSFLISTPQTGADSILASYAILGLPLTLWKVLTAFVSGVIGGTVAAWVTRDEPPSVTGGNAEVGAPPTRRLSFVAVTGEALRYGWGMLIRDIALWLVLGTLAGGAIAAFVPQTFLTQEFTNPYLQMLAVLVLAVPLYVCATGSLPIAAALVLKGLPLGAAIVFLIAGPATNVATLAIFSKVLGRRIAAVYLGTIIVTSFLFGAAFQWLFPGASLPSDVVHAHHHETVSGISPLEAITSTLLALLLARGLWVKWRERTKTETGTGTETETETETGTEFGSRAIARTRGEGPGGDMDRIDLNVEGMSCGHCRGTVEQALKAVAGVREVVVSLEEGRATVRGEGVDAESLLRAVRERGFEATPAGS